MAKYAISIESTEALNKLANDLIICVNSVVHYSDILDKKIADLSDGLGLYAKEISGITSRNKAILLQNVDLIFGLAYKINVFAEEIKQMCFADVGLRVDCSGSAINSYQRAKKGGELAIPSVSALSNELIDMFPAKRREAIHTSYANAPEKIINIVNRYAASLTSICESGYGRDSLGRLVKNSCFYSPQGKYIAMNEQLNDAEYTDVFKHEVGHFADDIMGEVSNSPEFISAMDSTASRFDSNTPEGRQRLNDMLDDAFNTGACFDRNVTDIISALLVNNLTVEQRFASESKTGYVANYMHDTKYWLELDEYGNPRNKRGSEIFANLFAIETDQYRISRNFVKRWFPEITGVFDSYIS